MIALQVSPSGDVGKEANLEEIIQGMCHQLKESKEELRDLKEKLLISEATVYSLANQLHKYGKLYIGSQSPNECSSVSTLRYKMLSKTESSFPFLKVNFILSIFLEV